MILVLSVKSNPEEPKNLSSAPVWFFLSLKPCLSQVKTDFMVLLFFVGMRSGFLTRS